MRTDDPPPAGLALRIFLLGSAVMAIVAVIVAVKRAPAARGPEPEPPAVAVLAPPAEPIAAEAQVFRTRPGMMAIEPEARREREAHPRTLKTFRYLRAYPGAPPRIPHGLTPAEFRTGTCNTCHGSGGTPRAYANTTLDWRTTAWPQLPRRTPDRSPPPIPHDLQSRGNCLPCHAGPAAVAEIRTAHPERADCRQCHVALQIEAGEFTRPARDVVAATGGVP